MNTTVRSPVRFTQPFATVTDHVCCSPIKNQAVSCQPLARYIVDIYILHVMHIPRRDYHFRTFVLSCNTPTWSFCCSIISTYLNRLTASPDIRHIKDFNPRISLLDERPNRRTPTIL